MSGKPKADFIVIGSMKSATSTVCAYLEDHPDVFMVKGSEPNYFCEDEVFAKGEDWYAAHFEAARAGKLRGEGSNDYAAREMYPDTVARMAAYNPDLKLVFMVRHPIKRIMSAWVQNRVDQGDGVPAHPDEAVRALPERFIGQSRYWHTLEGYRAHFPDTQIFIGFMEDLSRDPDPFWQALCGFLDIAPKSAERGHMNPSTDKRVPGKAYSLLNRVPLMDMLKRLIPAGLKDTVKQRLLSQKAAQVPELSDAMRAELRKTLAPEAKALLTHCGKPEDFWDI